MKPAGGHGPPEMYRHGCDSLHHRRRPFGHSRPAIAAVIARDALLPLSSSVFTAREVLQIDLPGDGSFNALSDCMNSMTVEFASSATVPEQGVSAALIGVTTGTCTATDTAGSSPALTFRMTLRDAGAFVNRRMSQVSPWPRSQTQYSVQLKLRDAGQHLRDLNLFFPSWLEWLSTMSVEDTPDSSPVVERTPEAVLAQDRWQMVKGKNQSLCPSKATLSLISGTASILSRRARSGSKCRSYHPGSGVQYAGWIEVTSD